MIESGYMIIGKKTGRPVCVPDWKSKDERREKEAVINWFHLECFLRHMKAHKGDTPLNECAICHADLFQIRYAFRMQVGHIDASNHNFVPLKDNRNLGLICTDCILTGFGNGDYALGEEVLCVVSK